MIAHGLVSAMLAAVKGQLDCDLMAKNLIIFPVARRLLRSRAPGVQVTDHETK
jgi:hypothetical protein